MARSRFKISADTSTGDTPSARRSYGGRQSLSPGLRPKHQFRQHGVFVVTSTATDAVTGKYLGKARKMIAISTKETGEQAPSETHGRSLGRTVGDAPNHSIITKGTKGKVSFAGKQKDYVTYTGKIKLPKGLDTSKPIELSIGIGNIVAVVEILPRGGGIAGEVQITDATGPLRYMKISYGVLKSPITKGGETATFTALISASGLVGSGLDTEGITNHAKDATPGQTVPRKIQVAMLLDGVPYENSIPVNFGVNKDSAFGTISGRN